MKRDQVTMRAVRNRRVKGAGGAAQAVIVVLHFDLRHQLQVLAQKSVFGSHFHRT